MIKKPSSNIPLQNKNFLPCSAYVNFATEEAALSAVNDLNGKNIDG
jgi:hypothetical protein